MDLSVLWFLVFLNFLNLVSCSDDDKPVIQDLLVSSKLVEGKKFHLTCNLNSGKQPVSFTWYHLDELVRPNDKKAITNAEEGSQLTIKEMSLADSGKYVCQVENAYGSDSRSVDLKLNGKF